jgi:cysteine-S-conjugate beta-lyase
MPSSYTFTDRAVPLELLRQRAFNHRWAQQEDPEVIPLTAADPDFPACQVIRHRLGAYVRSGVFSYGPPLGLPEFRGAVAHWWQTTRGVTCHPDQVFATDSVAAGMAAVARASLQPGDEVLIPDPVDFLFEHTVARAGGIVRRVLVRPGMDAAEYIAALEAQWTERTTMLWLCNPHNPLGLVFSADWLRAVATWAIERELRILSDEIWSDIVYSPHQYTAVASLSGAIAARTVTVYGFSKNFALAGLRVGCVICADLQWQRDIVTAADAESTVFGVAVLSQVAAIAAMEEGQPWLLAFREHLQAQRDYVAQRLARWPQTEVFLPQGTYVIFPKLLVGDVEVLVDRMRREAKVALVPGAPRWFGLGARGHVRLCFATSRGILRRACDRLDRFWQQLSVAYNDVGES